MNIVLKRSNWGVKLVLMISMFKDIIVLLKFLKNTIFTNIYSDEKYLQK